MRAIFLFPGSSNSPACCARHSFICPGIIKGFTCLIRVCVWAYCPWASWNTSKAYFQTNQTAHSAERVTCFWFPLSDLECPSPEQIACVQRQRQHWDWLEFIYVFAWRLPSYISHSAGHFNTQRLKTTTQLNKDRLETWTNFKLQVRVFLWLQNVHNFLFAFLSSFRWPPSPAVWMGSP